MERCHDEYEEKMQDAFRIYAEIAPATWWKSIRTVKLASLESDAIGFRQGDVFAGLKDEPRKLDLIGTLEFNYSEQTSHHLLYKEKRLYSSLFLIYRY